MTKINPIRPFSQTSRVDWLDSFADAIVKADQQPKNVVESARARNYESLLEQLNSIMSGKAKAAGSVDAKVKELQERTGLAEYLKLVNAQKEITAQDMLEVSDQEILPDIPEDLKEKIKIFVDNIIGSKHGNTAVIAITNNVFETFKNKGLTSDLVNSREFEKYVDDRIRDYKEKNPNVQDQVNNNLGKNLGTEIEVNESDDNNVWESFNSGGK